MRHQKQRRSFTADSREPAPKGFRLGRIVLIGFAVALVATAAFISSAASANLPDAEFAPAKEETLAADFAVQVDPLEQSVCKPDDAFYSVQVQALDGFTDTVTLDLSGDPDHTDVSFDPNPVEDPYTSTLTIGTKEPTNAGSYVMEISGATLTTTHTTTVGLDIFDGPPGTVTLTSPSDGAEDISLTPLLTWISATQAVSYTIEVDDDIAFGSIDYTATVTTTEHTVGVSLAEDTMYYWRVRGVNICDPGSNSDAFSFTTLANPTIDSTPAAFEESMIVNEVVTNTLTITNTGNGNLEWDIVEAESGNCASPGDISWVTLSDTSGSEGAGQSSAVDVILDAGGLAVDDYSGALCINSNDGSTPTVTVPLDMYVIDFALQAAPAEQDICAPDNAVYSVQVQPLNEFTRTVTLSLSGNPASTTVDFAPNNVAAPFTSTLTIGNTGAAVGGSYEMEITGISTPATHTTTVDLILDTVPAAVALTSPGDGAVDIPLKPLMDWQATAETINYTLQIDNNADFGSIEYTVTVTGTTEHLVTQYLQPDTEYYWRVRADNACGEGSYSVAFSFTTRNVPAVLLVDDADTDDADSRSIYNAALTALLGVGGYDYWDTENSDNEPDAEYLSFYNAVIWFTGSETSRDPAVAGPGTEGEAALATWLDSGGCYLISSQDYHWARAGVTSLMSNYLGVDSVIDDTGQEDVWGTNTVFAGLGPYAMNYPFNDYSDEIIPMGTAEVAFMGTKFGTDRNAAVNKQGTTYVTTYLGFPLEAIAAASDREEVLSTFLTWCDNEANPRIDSTPASFDEDMMANEVVINTLTITNIGSGNLVWDIGEADSGSCASTGAIDWVSLSETSGFTSAGLSSEIDVVFEPGSTPEGDYSGALCINSNDTSTPLITVPLDMSVEWYYVYIPFLMK